MEIYQKLIDKFGVEHQELILIEEMSELTKAIIKKSRGLEHNIEEEICDVLIVLEQLKLAYPEWLTWQQIKLKRIEEEVL
jgi:NTP pyrophosphatase (non-canonical NTP hydrolase)